MFKTMEVITDAPSSREMEHRLNTLQTSLNAVERSITRYENLIEDCRMQEERPTWRRRSPGSRRRRRSPMLRWLMRKSVVTLSPLAPMGRLIPRAPLLWPLLKMLSPPRRMPSSCSWHPNPKIQLLDLTVPGARPVQSVPNLPKSTWVRGR